MFSLFVGTLILSGTLIAVLGINLSLARQRVRLLEANISALCARLNQAAARENHRRANYPVYPNL